MAILLPYYLLSAAIAAALSIGSGPSGLVCAAFFLLRFAGAFLALLLLTVLLLALITAFIDPKKPQTVRNPFFCGLVTFVSGLLTELSRIRLHVSGAEKLPEGRWLLVENHRSNYDPLVTTWGLRKRALAFVSKPQNLRLPVAGPLAHKACYLSIDRENDRAALRTIQTAAELLQRGVTSFGIYPEGTRNPTSELLPFRNGAFKIAQKAGVPIVVAVVRGTDEVCRRFPWKHTDVYLDICAVMDAETVRRMKTSEIGEEVRTWITSASC